jgi:hypothetical protein
MGVSGGVWHARCTDIARTLHGGTYADAVGLSYVSAGAERVTPIFQCGTHVSTRCTWRCTGYYGLLCSCLCLV